MVCFQERSSPDEFSDFIDRQQLQDWNIHITPRMSKAGFLRYAGRYIRRLPISRKRILQVSEQEVVYQVKDTRQSKLARTMIYEEVRCTPAELVSLLSQHVLDRYQHSMRYFGLLAPRTKRQTSATVFALHGLSQRPRPPRLPWDVSIKKHFGADPLLDAAGNRMHWVGYRSPVPTP